MGYKKNIMDTIDVNLVQTYLQQIFHTPATSTLSILTGRDSGRLHEFLRSIPCYTITNGIICVQKKNWSLDKELGRGSFGQVLCLRSKDEDRALKTILFDDGESVTEKIFKRYDFILETLIQALLYQLCPTNMIPAIYMVGRITSTIPMSPTFTDDGLCAITDKMDFTLFQGIQHGHLTDMDVYDILVQLAHYLHELQRHVGFVHRDLHIRNVMITRLHKPMISPAHSTWTRFHVYVIDFGQACLNIHNKIHQLPTQARTIINGRTLSYWNTEHGDGPCTNTYRDIECVDGTPCVNFTHDLRMVLADLYWHILDGNLYPTTVAVTIQNYILGTSVHRHLLHHNGRLSHMVYHDIDVVEQIFHPTNVKDHMKRILFSGNYTYIQSPIISMLD